MAEFPTALDPMKIDKFSKERVNLTTPQRLADVPKPPEKHS